LVEPAHTILVQADDLAVDDRASKDLIQ
jgi:hypothetical protein